MRFFSLHSSRTLIALPLTLTRPGGDVTPAQQEDE
jgi:hypothetical protein